MRRADEAGTASGEEHPHVGAITRTRPFQCCRDAGLPRRVEIRQRVEGPTRPSKSHARSRQASPGSSGYRPAWTRRRDGLDDSVSERQVLPVRSSRVRPAPSHRGTPTGLARPVVLPPHRVHILAAREQREKQPHLRGTRRSAVDQRRAYLVRSGAVEELR